MPPSRSSSKSKRSILEETKGSLRAIFGIAPESPLLVAQKSEDVLREAWDLATDITAFAKKYLAHFMRDPVTEEWVEPAEFHKAIYQLLLTERHCAIAAPREHAKSTVVSVIFPLYCICYKLRRFIVLISDTQPQAALQLAAVKEELETNVELREAFGDLIGDKKWDVNDCRTKTGITIVARGAGQSLRGLRYRQWRPDLVICDDMENEEGVANPESRAKLVRWFKGTVMNLGRQCQIFVVGTILHFDSFLSDLLSDSKFPSFKKLRYQACDLITTGGTIAIVASSILWPAKWPLEALEQKLHDVGIVFFNQEYRNLPISEETQVFEEGWISTHQYFRNELPNLVLVKISYHDPAISESRKADYFGSVTIGIDLDTGRIYVLRAEQLRMPFLKQVNFILELADNEQPEVIGVEDQAYQVALRQTLEATSVETGRYYNFVGVQHLTDKFMRIATLSGLVQNGTLRFCMDGSMSALIQQLIYLGKIKDDLADALESAVSIARKMNFKAVIATGDTQTGERSGTRGVLSRILAVVAGVGRQNKPRELIQRSRRSRWDS